MPHRQQMRPLRRIAYGVWKSRDERWTFLCHNSDPHPQRWFAYLGDSDEPTIDPEYTLGALVVGAEQEDAR